MKPTVKLDPYVAEIVKRNTDMSYLLGRAESLLIALNDLDAIRDSSEFLGDETVMLIEDISNYYEGL